jgi:hypothetical protein
MANKQVTLEKQVFGAGSFPQVVDTSFREFAPTTIPDEPEITVEAFFDYYEKLFFDIPIVGAVNSHEYLVKTSSEYIGGDLVSDNEQALLEEINTLRSQLLEANQNLLQFRGII